MRGKNTPRWKILFSNVQYEILPFLIYFCLCWSFSPESQCKSVEAVKSQLWETTEHIPFQSTLLVQITCVITKKYMNKINPQNRGIEGEELDKRCEGGRRTGWQGHSLQPSAIFSPRGVYKLKMFPLVERPYWIHMPLKIQLTAYKRLVFQYRLHINKYTIESSMKSNWISNISLSQPGVWNMALKEVIWKKAMLSCIFNTVAVKFGGDGTES